MPALWKRASPAWAFPFSALPPFQSQGMSQSCHADPFPPFSAVSDLSPSHPHLQSTVPFPSASQRTSSLLKDGVQSNAQHRSEQILPFISIKQFGDIQMVLPMPLSKSCPVHLTKIHLPFSFVLQGWILWPACSEELSIHNWCQSFKRAQTDL